MATLHDALQKAIETLCSDNSVKKELVRSIIAKHGLSLSEEQLQSIAKAIDDGEDSVCIRNVDAPEQQVAINADDIEQALLELHATLGAGVQRAVEHALDQIAPSIVESLNADLPQKLDWQRDAQKGFEARLYRRWQSGIDKLEVLLAVAHESRETFLDDRRRETIRESASEETVLLEVLAALHFRACRITAEILCLLKAGYADGADARWRSLHEIAVIGHFLLKHRGDVPQRYLDHASIEDCRVAEQYQEHCHLLGYEPFATAELTEMRNASDSMLVKYGAAFKGDYGWASQALGKGQPTFAQIERDLDMSHWRPFFRLACRSVHAGSQGLFSSLAVPECNQPMLVAGASDYGLADPGQRAAISLAMASIALLTPEPTLDSLVASKCMLMLCDEIGKALFHAHESFELELRSG